MQRLISLIACLVFLGSSPADAATHRAKPGDDLQAIVNRMQKGDELLLADGEYKSVCVDFRGKSGLTVRAENFVPVKIQIEQGEPMARGGAVILRGEGKPFVLAGGGSITIRGLVIDGCSNVLQSGALKCDSGWLVEDVIVQRTDTFGVQVDGNENRRAQNITLKRVVAQDNGYLGIGGAYADHVRLSDCGSFRNNRGWDRNAFGEQGFERNGKWYCRVPWEAGGGKFALCDDVVIERHWAQGNNGPGLWFDYENRNIVVRDSKGNFVPDLRPEDIQVYEDGVLQELVSMTVVTGGRVYNPMAPPAASSSRWYSSSYRKNRMIPVR
jgi:hypothetical protein